mgnify:CR=1 FL=1
MNILVTGANGQLGNEMRIVSRGSADNYIFTDVAELDITDLEAVRSMVAEKNVKAIVNCAAYTNVDKAEEDVEFCELLNAKAVENLAVAMKEVDGLLVHVSTDYVFGGDPYNTPCTEDKKGTPTGVYGLSKLHGEQNIQRVGCHHLILRTAWLYSEFGKNFVKTMLRLGSERAELGVVFDQIGSPTYARDLARAIHHIVAVGVVPGIYHYSNEGVCSWYDFTKAIFELGGITTCALKPLHTDEYPTPAARPHYSVLDKTKIKQTYGVEVPYWMDSLRECIEQLS